MLIYFCIMSTFYWYNLDLCIIITFILLNLYLYIIACFFFPFPSSPVTYFPLAYMQMFCSHLFIFFHCPFLPFHFPSPLFLISFEHCFHFTLSHIFSSIFKLFLTLEKQCIQFISLRVRSQSISI